MPLRPLYPGTITGGCSFTAQIQNSRTASGAPAADASSRNAAYPDEPFAAIDRRSIAVMLEVLRAQAAAARRAWVLADYEAPPGVPLAATLVLPG